MEIEYKNKDYKNKNIYKVGSVIEDAGNVYLVCQKGASNGCTEYFLINLCTATVSSKMHESLKELELTVGDEGDTLVKAKLIVDYKLDGDAKDENTK